MKTLVLLFVLALGSVFAADADPVPPVAAVPEKPLVRVPPEKGLVWHTLKSRAYHVEGTYWYGRSKHGEWMTEAAAIAKGYEKVSPPAKASEPLVTK